MSQTISRMYEKPSQAARAKAALEDEDYSDVHLVSGDSAGASVDDITAAIAKGNVLKSLARVYAAGVSKGGSLVTVHAPFGGAARAARILDKFGPIDSGISEPADGIMLWDDATPMSCILQMPVLMADPVPFSRFWNVPPLANGSFSLSSLFGLRLLTTAAPRSTSFGIPLLSSNPAPLSSLLGLPTLSKRQSARR
jgi:hypothetical protein